MAKYHIGKNGPGVCRATKRDCPVGGDHFESMAEAVAAQEKLNSGKTLAKPIVKKAKNIPAPINFEKYKFPMAKYMDGLDDGATLREYNNYLKNIHEKYSDVKNIRALNAESHAILDPNGEALDGFDELEYSGNGVLSFNKSIDENEIEWGYYEEFYPETFSKFSQISASPHFDMSRAEVGGYYDEEIIYTVTYDINRIPELKKKFDEYHDYSKTGAAYIRSQSRELPEWASLPINQTEAGVVQTNDKFKKEFGGGNSGRTKFMKTAWGEEVRTPKSKKDEKANREETIERLSYFYPSSNRDLRLSEATKWVDANPKLMGKKWPTGNLWNL